MLAIKILLNELDENLTEHKDRKYEYNKCRLKSSRGVGNYALSYPRHSGLFLRQFDKHFHCI